MGFAHVDIGTEPGMGNLLVSSRVWHSSTRFTPNIPSVSLFIRRQMAYGLRGLIPDCLTRGGLGDIGLHNHHRGYGSRRYLPYDYDIEVSPFARKRTCLGCLEREAAIREHIEAENCLHEEPIYGCDNPSYGYFYEDPRCGRGYPDYRRR
jgi:hypothetical protein